MNAFRTTGFAFLGSGLLVFGACGPKTSTGSRPAGNAASGPGSAR